MDTLHRCLAAAFVSLIAAASAWTQESGSPSGPAAAAKPAGPRHIVWAKTWESALFEAKNRNVPIYILVSIGEG